MVANFFSAIVHINFLFFLFKSAVNLYFKVYIYIYIYITICYLVKFIFTVVCTAMESDSIWFNGALKLVGTLDKKLLFWGCEYHLVKSLLKSLLLTKSELYTKSDIHSSLIPSICRNHFENFWSTSSIIYRLISTQCT